MAKIAEIVASRFSHRDFKPDEDWRFRNVNRDGTPNYDPQKLLPAPVERGIPLIASDANQIWNDDEAAMHIAREFKVEEEFSLEQVRAAMYFAIPEEFRPSPQKIGEYVGVSFRTIYTWLQSPKIQGLKMQILKTYATRHAPEILAAVTENAKHGCVRSGIAMLELYGMIAKDKPTSSVQNNFIAISKDDIQDVLAGLREIKNPEQIN